MICSKKGVDSISRKAQITVFMILGLIVLLSVVLLISFKTNVLNRQPQTDTQEIDPVKRYVEACIEQTAERGARLMGQQGGFITIPTSIAFNPSRYLNPDGIGIIKIPLWFYKGQRYNPSLRIAQRELSSYVEEQVDLCLNNFEAFSEQYDITVLGEKKVSSAFNQKDIVVSMNFPIRVAAKTNSTHTVIEEYQARIPVRLRKVLSTAEELMEAELSGLFLENFTIDLMASNPDVPFTDVRFTCNRLEWPIDDVRSEIEQMLTSNYPRIRIKNTAHSPFLENERVYEKLKEHTMDDIAEGNFPDHVPEDAYEYLRMFWDAGLEKDESISAGIEFLPSVGIDLSAQPHDNGILRSKLAPGNRELFSFFCMNIFHFLYDVNYPVRISLRDSKSFDGKGYTFSFALPVTIKNNEPFKQDYGYDLFTTTYFDRGFCEERGLDFVDIRAVGSEDGFSNLELNDVNLSLECFKYYCPLGKTKPDSGAYRLYTALPSSCANPFITAEKEGYLPSKKQLSGSELTLELTRLKKMDYEVVIHEYNSLAESLGEAQQLEQGMNVSIQLVGPDYTAHKVYPLSLNVPSHLRTLDLIEADATYDLTIVLTQDDEYIGGYNGKWFADGAAVADSEKVVFHAIRYIPMPFTKEEKLEMVSYVLTGDYHDQIAPHFE